MSRLYLDACTIIYLLEASSVFQDLVIARLLEHRAKPDPLLLTSRLSRLECRVVPLRNQDEGLLTAYEAFFSADRMIVIDVSATIIERATELRARYGFKSPDALHLATAIEHKADAFLTSDGNLERCGEITVEVLVAPEEEAPFPGITGPAREP
ncbi:MAG: type II toxin-antitoxin system VapC family toxin [Thermoanaerobaculia bacterium]|nr:type II toxin-antitoxin system VapC family toxin [Thermoanaerobaculia bacterium]